MLVSAAEVGAIGGEEDGVVALIFLIKREDAKGIASLGIIMKKFYC